MNRSFAFWPQIGKLAAEDVARSRELVQFDATLIDEQDVAI